MNIFISGVTAIALGALFLLKSTLYAATKINIPLATRARWAISSSALSLKHVIEDVINIAVDIFVLLYYTAAFLNQTFKIADQGTGH